MILSSLHLGENAVWIQDSNDPQHSYRYIQDYAPPGVIRRIGAGNSSAVGLLKDGAVLKYPLVKGENEHALIVEKAIYDAIGDHKRIVRCLGLTEDGLKLQFASQGSIAFHLRTKFSTLDLALRLRWCRQAAEAVSFVHSKGVIHCDISTHNVLLDDDLNVLLSDFQGKYQQLDGYAMESARYFLPREIISSPNELTDIFALGTLIYTIMSGSEPYPQLSDTEVQECFRKQEFPDTDSIVCGRVISQCWNQEYTSSTEVIHDLVDL